MVSTVPYQVVRELRHSELRRYDDIMLATAYDMDDDESFRHLFQYIGGNNAGGLRMPMTAPVVSRSGPRRQMSFVLPWGMEMDAFPDPRDPKVLLERLEGGVFAVKSFRGRAGREDVDKMVDELMDELQEAGYMAQGPPFLMRYNSPFAPGFMRHNEVAVRVAPK